MNNPNPPRPAAGTPAVKRTPLPPPVDPLLARSAARPRPTIPNAQPPARKPVVGKRVKPARAAKMVSLGLSAVSTVAMAGLFARHDVAADDGSSIVLATPAIPATTSTAGSAVTTTVEGTTVTSTGGTTATTAATVPAAGTIGDGTYLGSASSNRWGIVQVQAVYSGGQLIDVQILQYPNGDNRSISINQRALPTLINAAISAQSASVSNISGATYTSRSYVDSLQSAIDAAKAASGISG